MKTYYDVPDAAIEIRHPTEETRYATSRSKAYMLLEEQDLNLLQLAPEDREVRITIEGRTYKREAKP